MKALLFVVLGFSISCSNLRYDATNEDFSSDGILFQIREENLYVSPSEVSGILRITIEELVKLDSEKYNKEILYSFAENVGLTVFVAGRIERCPHSNFCTGLFTISHGGQQKFDIDHSDCFSNTSLGHEYLHFFDYNNNDHYLDMEHANADFWGPNYPLIKGGLAKKIKERAREEFCE
jgi:hypothetical protein